MRLFSVVFSLQLVLLRRPHFTCGTFLIESLLHRLFFRIRQIIKSAFPIKYEKLLVRINKPSVSAGTNSLFFFFLFYFFSLCNDALNAGRLTSVHFSFFGYETVRKLWNSSGLFFVCFSDELISSSEVMREKSWLKNELILSGWKTVIILWRLSPISWDAPNKIRTVIKCRIQFRLIGRKESFVNDVNVNSDFGLCNFELQILITLNRD